MSTNKRSTTDVSTPAPSRSEDTNEQIRALEDEIDRMRLILKELLVQLGLITGRWQTLPADPMIAEFADTVNAALANYNARQSDDIVDDLDDVAWARDYARRKAANELTADEQAPGIPIEFLLAELSPTWNDDE